MRTSAAGSGAAPLPSAVLLGVAMRAETLFRFLLPVFGLLAVWELVVRAGLADATILPAPTMIAERAAQLLGASGGQAVLLDHIGHSLYRALAAFLLAVAIAVPLGFMLGLSETAEAWVGPVLSLMLPLPAVAWTPVFLVIFGQGDATIVWVCFLGAVFPVLYSTMQGVRAIGRHTLWVVRSMGATPPDIFLRVLVPASLPTLMAGLKLGMAHSWRTLVAAEMLAALSAGLGYMIFAARSYMDVTTMFVGILCLAIIGMTIEHLVFGALERRTVRRWYGAARMGGAS
jgi:NitT/TauT family transport system permease protein